MPDFRRLVDRVADALGPEAPSSRVENVLGSLLDEVLTAAEAEAEAAPPASGRVDVLTLGVSLRDCASRLPQTVRARAYDKVRRSAALLPAILGDLAREEGIEVGSLQLAVTPVSLVAGGAGPADLVALADVLDQAARHVEADALSGFTAFYAHGVTPGDDAFLTALPRVLAATERLGAAVVVADAHAGLAYDAAWRVAQALHEAPPEATIRLAVLGNPVPGLGWSPCAYHDPADGGNTVGVGLDVAPHALRALRALSGDADLGSAARAVADATAGAVRSGARVAARVAAVLAERTGAALRPGRVTCTLGDTAPLLAALGVSDPNGPGASAARFLLAGAVRRGAGPAGMFFGTGVTSVRAGTPADTLAAHLLDGLSDGLNAGGPTSVRLAIGDAAVVRGTGSTGAFARRGGHLPPA